MADIFGGRVRKGVEREIDFSRGNSYGAPIVIDVFGGNIDTQRDILNLIRCMVRKWDENICKLRKHYHTNKQIGNDCFGGRKRNGSEMRHRSLTPKYWN